MQPRSIVPCLLALAAFGPLDAQAGALFEDRSQGSGLGFHHFNGMSGEYYFVEVMGAGAALFDYDRDGDLDAYLVQGGLLGATKSLEDMLFAPRHPLPLEDRLYRNELISSAPEGGGRLRFTDVTAESGLTARAYGQGVAVGDVDNDGWPDLYLTAFGENQLWLNRGDGTFLEVTKASGSRDGRWNVAAVFFDYDRDGLLDLFVSGYTNFTLPTNKTCLAESGRRAHCGPLSFGPVADRLLKNLGGAKFEDVTIRAGLAAAKAGAGLGAVAFDANGDGWQDLYVANDGSPNHLWLNQGDGTFLDDGMFAGAAVSALGHPEASMGASAADFDGDGDEDLLLTHLSEETNTVYLNNGKGLFDDVSATTGLGPPSWKYTGFGTAWFDYDNDGLLDVLAVNGEIKAIPELESQGDPYPLHQPNQLFHNSGPGEGPRFQEVTAQAGEVFRLSEVSRGAAFGDVDNDGDLDVLVTNNNGPARLLINLVGQAHAWAGLEVVSPVDSGLGSPALGAWVGLHRSRAPTLWRRLATGGSYASASDPRLIFGLGSKAGAEKAGAPGPVEVRWPDGTWETFPPPPVGAYTTLVKGSGTAGRKSVP